MSKGLYAALLFCSVATAGGVDEYFHNGALGINWGSTLQQVQAAYPNGRTIPFAGGVTGYTIPGGMRVLKVDVPASDVSFQFTKTDVLERIFIHFDYSQRDLVLYGAAEALGQDYTTEDGPRERRYKWKPGHSSLAVMQIGKEPYGWVIVVVQPTTRAMKPRSSTTEPGE